MMLSDVAPDGYIRETIRALDDFLEMFPNSTQARSMLNLLQSSFQEAEQ